MSAKISPQNRLRDDITQSNGLQLALTSLVSKNITNRTHLWIILKEIPPFPFKIQPDHGKREPPHTDPPSRPTVT